MIGDPEYSSKHQHGVKESTQGATGAHLMERNRHTEPKLIQKVHTPYRGHTQLDFTDGSTMLLERGEYEVLPKAGDYWPQKAATDGKPSPPNAETAPDEAETTETLGEA